MASCATFGFLFETIGSGECGIAVKVCFVDLAGCRWTKPLPTTLSTDLPLDELCCIFCELFVYRLLFY